MRTGRRVCRLALVATGASMLAALAWTGTAAAGVRQAAATTTPGVSLSGSGGCSGAGTSYNGKGNLLSSATAPGGGGASSSRPLVVDRSGTVRWHGSTATVITNHHWYVHVDGIPVKSGGSANAGHSTHSAGVEKVSSYLPSWLGLTGVFYVDGKISGTGGSCVGAVYVKITGNAAGGILLWIGIGLVLLALLTLYAALPRALMVAPAVPAPRADPPIATPGAGPTGGQP